MKTAHGRLMLTVLGGLVEFERELIRARAGEGGARAVARSREMGRLPKQRGQDFKAHGVKPGSPAGRLLVD
jgi:DNA invertase Pin-like site-specific DNA recombinase